ncbi:FtsH protease activity modulator HflK [Porticoccaceae bacterium LTM1]|nr:FtsH protease activity modulator HflK [Porticoccaceae bacterium LTM1]
MAWNEPGGGRDPWGGKNNGDGPPDLDEALKKLRDKFNKAFGGSGGSNNGKGNGAAIGVIAVIAIIVWALFGVYQVDEKDKAVILRFGKYHDTVGSGLHWNPKFIDTVNVVSVTKEQSYTTQGLMLTKDLNIVDLPVTVQFTVPDAKAYVLNVRDPVESLRNAADSAIRHVVGSTTASDVLSEGRQKLAGEISQRLQKYIDIYDTGISISSVNIGKGQPPVEVKAAFDDVNASKKDKDRYIKEAEAYSNEVVPVARGKAQRMLQDAQAYRDRVVAEADGDAQRFEKLMTEYQKAPEVTRRRIYLDAMESVMSNSSKVMVDVEGGNNMMYLPLDKLMEGRSVLPSTTRDASAPSSTKEQVREVVEEVLRDMTRDQQIDRRRESRR